MLAYEDLMAFFLEASFLGVLLFGRKLVPRWAHFFAACMVAIGTLFSTFWIISVNSWMQTPAGYEIKDGRFFPTDWMAIIFSPSFLYRLSHTVTAFYVTTAFAVLGVGAYLLRNRDFPHESKLMIKMALNILIILVPLQMVLGDMHGLNTRQYQPAKLAAIEGRWDTAAPSPLTLFGIPNQAAERNDYQIEIPVLGSIVLTHTLDGEVKGLKDFPPDQRPPVWPVFFGFRIMVGHRLPHAVAPSCWAGTFGYAAACSLRPGSSGSAWRWRHSASSPCWPAGRPPRSGGSPGPFMVFSAPRNPSRPR